MPNKDEDRHKAEFLALLAVFEKVLEDISDDWTSFDVLEELMALRADFAIHHALDGFNIEYDAALELLRNADEGLTEQDRVKRDVIVAAVDNLVDFAVAEEYQMMLEYMDEDDGEDDDEGVFVKYNNRYALIENQDAEYAMVIAAQLIAIANETVLMYMTQGDERVRPWHLQFEGFSAPKSSFPVWLVPPIEHACRCYLVEDGVRGAISDVLNMTTKTPEMPEWFNPTFKESVAFGGRIFSDDHPYFKVQSEHAEALRLISDRIKSKYFNG